MSIKTLIASLTVLLLILTGCSVDTVRNPDGSLSATSTISEASLSSEIAAALENEQISNVNADLQDGIIIVTADRLTDTGSTVAVSFHLTLTSVNGRLTAQITDFTVNGQPVAESRLDKWNENIANRLDRAADRRPNRTLESVSIAGDILTMVWHIETPASIDE